MAVIIFSDQNIGGNSCAPIGACAIAGYADIVAKATEPIANALLSPLNIAVSSESGIGAAPFAAQSRSS
jgi:hypothetical protein